MRNKVYPAFPSVNIVTGLTEYGRSGIKWRLKLGNKRRFSLKCSFTELWVSVKKVQFPRSCLAGKKPNQMDSEWVGILMGRSREPIFKSYHPRHKICYWKVSRWVGPQVFLSPQLYKISILLYHGIKAWTYDARIYEHNAMIFA